MTLEQKLTEVAREIAVSRGQELAMDPTAEIVIPLQTEVYLYVPLIFGAPDVPTHTDVPVDGIPYE